MKVIKAFAIVLMTTFMSFNGIAQIKLLPWPTTVVTKKDSLQLNRDINIIAAKNLSEEASQLKQILNAYFNSATIYAQKRPGSILLKKNTELQKDLGDEGYELNINESGIEIHAASNKGIYYGIQTLRQILYQSGSKGKQKLTIPLMQIKDKPAFAWRAFMLDESRYFKGKQIVKQLIDQMALLKMNVFHWHLTDDQGWRIEIKKYPRLTSIGAKRKDSQTGGWDSNAYSGKPHEGFYTQQQIKNIVNYAKSKHIIIVPEIEMPGHSAAAIAAYPWLGTVKDSAIEVPARFGKHYDVIDVTDPKVFKFYRDVLLEVMELFPSKVIHIGGDEVAFNQWKNSKKVQAYMREKDLKSPADLQIHYTNKVSNFIDSHNRKMMGWNDILGGNVHEWQSEKDMTSNETLALSTIIHFWKGDKKLLKDAIARGYSVVNSEHSFTYLDYNYNTISLKKAYSFNPVPEGLTAEERKKVLGLGCQMWGEWIPGTTDLNQQVYPRIAAYAEIGWTSEENKNYERFVEALKSQLVPVWKKEEIGFYNVQELK